MTLLDLSRKAAVLAFNGLATTIRHHVLAHPERYEWSLQGFGMLRTYVSRELRLHVWDDRFRVPNVSDVHDHPWDFESLVLSGSLTNIPYCVVQLGDGAYAPDHHEGRIVCGPSTDVKTAERITPDVYLSPGDVRTYGPGDVYSQKADEVHRSQCERGTVTLVARTWTGKDPERALVYWPLGTEWTSAHPRPATDRERDEICAYAYEHWRWP